VTVRAARGESVGITIEDVARLALRRACLVSRFLPLDPERILWLRKRRRRKRRRRLRSRRRARSNPQARVELQLRPGTGSQTNTDQNGFEDGGLRVRFFIGPMLPTLVSPAAIAPKPSIPALRIALTRHSVGATRFIAAHSQFGA